MSYVLVQWNKNKTQESWQQRVKNWQSHRRVVYKYTRKERHGTSTQKCLCPLPADSTSQLNILGHDSHAFSMDSTQVGVLEQPDQIRLRCFLQCQNRGTLEPQIRLEVLSNFPYQPLEWQLTDQKLRRLLVLANLTESNSPRPVPVGLLDSPCCRRRLPRGLRRQLLPRSLASGRLPRSLLSTSHQRERKQELVQNNRALISEKLQKCRRCQDWKQRREYS